MDLPEAVSETVPLTTVCDRSVTQWARSRHSVSGYFMAILIVGIICLFIIVKWYAVSPGRLEVSVE